MSPLYWERHPEGLFVTLIAVAATYLHPENNEPDSLKALARRGGATRRCGCSSSSSAKPSETRASC